MYPNERLRRPEPERTGPNRDMNGIYRQPDPWARDGAEGRRSFDQGPNHSGEGPPWEGVKTAYQVYENWFREGQRSAQFNSRRWNDPRYEPRGSGAPTNETAQRAMRSYYNMVPTFADFVTSMATLWCSQLYPYQAYSQYAPYPPRPYGPFYPQDPASGYQGDPGAGIAVDIRPPDRGSYNRQIYKSAAAVKVTPLVSKVDDPNNPDPARRPLTAKPNIDNNRITIRIDIPAVQAAGEYVGAVLDAQNQLIGNLTVTVNAAPPPPPPPPAPHPNAAGKAKKAGAKRAAKE
jgi:hypothetical protein